MDAEAQPCGLVHVDLFLDGERRRRRAVEQADLVYDHLDLARGQVGVHRLRRTALHDAAHQDHVLGAQLTRALVTRRRAVGLEHDLDQSLSIAQVDEDHTAVIAPALHPAGQHHLLTDQGRRDVGRRVAATQRPHGVQCGDGPGHGSATASSAVRLRPLPAKLPAVARRPPEAPSAERPAPAVDAPGLDTRANEGGVETGGTSTNRSIRLEESRVKSGGWLAESGVRRQPLEARHSSSEAEHTRLRPRDFARYIALSD
jgi:hypothetical protein